MTTLMTPPTSAPTAVSPELLAILESRAEQLQTAVHATLRQHLFQNHGRLMTPRLLPAVSQQIVQDFLHYLRHTDLPHLTVTVGQLADQGLGHLSALAVTDTLVMTSIGLLPETTRMATAVHISAYSRHFLHQYMQARENITINARENFYQNVEAALEKQIAQERELRQELVERSNQLTHERAILNSLLNSVPDLIFYKDISGKYLGCNVAFSEFSGQKVSDLVGKTDFDLFPHDVAAFFREQDAEMLAQGQTRNNEEWVDYPDGRRVLLDTLKTSFYDENHNLLGLIGISRDITASYQSQLEVRRLGYVVEQSLDGTAVADMNGIIEFANPAWAAMHGYEVAELIGQHLSIFHTAEQLAQEVLPLNETVVTTGQAHQAEVGHVRKDGSVFPTLMTIAILKDTGNSPIGLVASAQDISERKAAEQALRENQARLAEAVGIARLHSWEFDVATQQFTFLPAYYELLGTSAEEEGGYTMSAADYSRKYVPDFEASIVEQEVVAALTTTDPNYYREFDSLNVTKDGRIIPIRVRFRIVKDEEGRTIKTIGANQDITEQMKTEEALAKRARELQAVADVNTAISTLLEPATLLQEVSDLTKTRFNLYHAHIYLLDEASQTLVLTAGAGEVGQTMVAQGWQIPLNRERSLVARAARTRSGAIANDVRGEPDFLPNLLLPETRAELAVPIVIGEQVIGVLDLQAAEVGYFSEEDIIIQTTLATQIGVAVQNARSFAESESARRELDQITRRLTREGWQDYLAQQELKPELNFVVGQAPDNGQALNQSLMVQGEKIGQLMIADPQAFTSDADDIITAVAERLSSHIENLRLSAQTEAALAQTEQQANRLAVLNEMGAALSNADTLNDIYQIATQYAGQILPNDHTSLALLDSSGDSFVLMALQGSTAGKIPGEHLPFKGTAVARALQEQRLLVAPQDFALNDMPYTRMLAEEGMQSFICAPLMVGDRPLGALNIGSHKANAFGTTDAYIIRQVVSLLAATLESHRLFEETRRRAEREALVNAISQKIQNAPTIQSAMQTAVTELGKALQVKRAVVELSQTGPLPQR
jgi:PAS domain S-box-containing protein